MTTDPFYASMAAAAGAHRTYPAVIPPQPHLVPVPNHVLVTTTTAYRDASQAPLRKLSVDLIKTYKYINEVGTDVVL